MAALAVGLASLVAALGAHAGGALGQQPTVAGTTTADETITGDPEAEFSTLATGPGEPHVVREELVAAQPGRAARRTSLAYFGQISDFQLADEESPARVEFFDSQPLATFSGSGHRPHEALTPHAVDSIIRQMNNFAQSPVAVGDGSRAEMLNVVLTGDLADSNQRNEVEWVLRLLEGGELDPNSGVAGAPGACGLLDPLLDDPRAYTGVQDYDDYHESPLFWDPDRPFGRYSNYPSYPGLMDRAQVPFEAEGLAVPSYIAVGNHDVLVQGNEDALAPYEAVATGCLKPMTPLPEVENPFDTLDPEFIAGLLASDPDKVSQVPADPRRQYVDKSQYRGVIAAGEQDDDAHGFAFVDQAELEASNGAAAYYSFSPEPGLRFVVLDTNGQGSGFLVDPTTQATTAEGNLDDPQFRWLEREVEEAEQNGELVISFAHHATDSLEFSLPDELATPCTAPDAHGHDVNPGCDRDPRDSQPIHLGDDLEAVVDEHPNYIAHVAGHSHENKIRTLDGPGPGAGWEIKSPAIADWPPQARLIEVMDNGDGTLSLFATLVNTEAPVAAPGSGTVAGAFTPEQLASIQRTLTFNDPQVDRTEAEGEPEDRNVELLLDDPRQTTPPPPPPPRPLARSCAGRPATQVGTPGDDRGPNGLVGTRRRDVVHGRAGDDQIRGRRGGDRACGGRGNDELRGGPGRDRLRGGDRKSVV